VTKLRKVTLEYLIQKAHHRVKASVNDCVLFRGVKLVLNTEIRLIAVVSDNTVLTLSELQ